MAAVRASATSPMAMPAAEVAMTFAAMTRARRGVARNVGRMVPCRISPVIDSAPSSAPARRDPAQPPAALAELTDREREVLRLVAHGLSNAEIAGRLVISPLTAKTHVSNILQKLDRRDRAALVALAYETGVVAPGDPP
jgi:DNA-binding NarL/FixJ family response regulator